MTDTPLTKNNNYDGRPAWSPDGTKIAFISERDGHWQIYVVDAYGSNTTLLIQNGRIQYIPAWSPDGKKIAFAMNESSPPDRDVYAVNIDGAELINLSRHPGNDHHPSWSPDSQRIVSTSDRDGNPEIYVVGVDGFNLSHVTFNDAPDTHPTWSPVEDKIAFVSQREASRQIYLMNADGSNQVNLNNGLQDWVLPSWGIRFGGGQAWSSDGRQVLFTCVSSVILNAARQAVSNEDIFVINVDGSQRITIADSLAKESQPSWSPDGTKIVFTYSRHPPLPDLIPREIYVAQADGSSSPVRLTNHVEKGGLHRVNSPNWSPPQ